MIAIYLLEKVMGVTKSNGAASDRSQIELLKVSNQ